MIDLKEGIDGKPSLRIVNAEPDHTQMNQKVTVKPNTRYQLSGYIKTKDVEPVKRGAKEGAELMVAGGWSRTVPMSHTGPWVRVSHDFVTGNETEIVVGMSLGHYGAMVSGTAWFCDLSLVEDHEVRPVALEKIHAPLRVTPAAPEPVRDVFPRLSVVGEWRVTHPDWTDVLTLRADGSMVTTRQGTTGRWNLTSDKGTPVIVFRWDKFGTESFAMVSPDHFRAQIRNGRFADMQRASKGAEERPKAAKQ